MESLFAEVATLVPPVMLVSLRVAVALALVPAPLGSGSPTIARALVSIAVGTILTLAQGPFAGLRIEPAALLVAAVGEVAVGTIVGATVRVALAAAEVAGDLAGTSMGLGFASSIDPTTGEEALVPARVLAATATLLFFASGGHHVVLAALAATIELAPPGRAFAVLANGEPARIGAELFGAGLRIASPVVGTMLVVQIAVALLSRAAPRLALFPLVFATAGAVGLVTLLVSAPAMLPAIDASIHAIPARLDAALGGGG